MRQDRFDRDPGPRRARRRVRELLPAAAGRLHRLRAPASAQLRRRRQSGLQDVHAAGHKRLRPLRPGPPAAAQWPEGLVCDTCCTSALRRRACCAACGQERRLIAPPGPGAIICADCACLPLTHLCALCGVEDKLSEKGRCAAAACAAGPGTCWPAPKRSPGSLPSSTLSPRPGTPTRP